MDTNGHIPLCEDYVSFETAKLLKEKGFEGDFCHTAYDWNGEFFWYGDYSKDRKGIMDAPTLQMAMKWLREVHKRYMYTHRITYIRNPGRCPAETSAEGRAARTDHQD